MGEVLPMPAVGDVFTDVRGDDRTMRVSYHQDRGVVVISLWAGPICRGTFRLAGDDVGRLAELLAVLRPDTAPAPDPAETGDVSRARSPAVAVPRVA